MFDFDGLILDTEWCEYRSIADEFARFGHDYPVSRFQRFVGSAWPTGWTRELIALVPELTDTPATHDELLAHRRVRRDELLAGEGIMPGVLELLDLAQVSGIGLAVASSSSRDWVEGHLERLGLYARFATVLSRDHVERAKPAPDLFTAASRALGAAPAACVAFEDSHNGCTAAKAAGLRCVVVPNRITQVQDFAHADLVASSLLELELEVLRRLVTGG